MKTKIKQILDRANDVLQNYAFVLLMALLAAVSAVILIDNDILSEESRNTISRFGLVSAMGISLLFALNMLSERIGKKVWLNIAGISFLLVYFQFFLPHNNKDFGDVTRILLMVSFILSHLLVSFIAFLGKKNEMSFWQYNKNLFINIVLTGVFTAVLVGGIMLAIAATDNLFELELDNKIYPQTFSFLAIFGSSFIFLLFTEDGLKYLEKDSDYPLVLKFFVQFVLIPLLIIYVIILYFYGGKILMRWKLPQGWVSLLILAYSIVGTLALLLVFPLKELKAKTWVKGFNKIFYFALLPLLVLLYVAIFTRILEYGFTENRYYVLLMAIWLTAVVLYFSFWKKANIKFIPISLFVLMFISLVLPYFNTFSVAKKSQIVELKEILKKNNLIENGVIDFNKKVQDSVATEIAEKFNFLNQRKEKEFLLTFFAKDKQLKFHKIFEEEKYSILYDVKDEFKNVVHSKSNNNYTEDMPYKRVYSEKSLYDAKGYDYVFFMDNNTTEKIENIDHYVLSVKSEQNFNGNSLAKIELESPTKVTQTYDLVPFLKEKVKLDHSENNHTSLSEISTEFDLHDYHFKIYISSINGNTYNKKEKVSFGDMLMFIKKKQASAK